MNRMTNEEAIKLMSDMKRFLRYGFAGDIRIVQVMNMAIRALKRENHRCHNCTNEQHCKVAQRLGANGFCSEWEGEEDGQVHEV